MFSAAMRGSSVMRVTFVTLGRVAAKQRSGGIIIIIRTHVKHRIQGASYRYNPRLTPLFSFVWTASCTPGHHVAMSRISVVSKYSHRNVRNDGPGVTFVTNVTIDTLDSLGREAAKRWSGDTLLIIIGILDGKIKRPHRFAASRLRGVCVPGTACKCMDCSLRSCHLETPTYNTSDTVVPTPEPHLCDTNDPRVKCEM